MTRFLKKPENWFKVQTFYGAQNGWADRGLRAEADVDRLLSLLNRIDPDRIHRKFAA